uniref:Transmembrane protein n=1 Tax=Arabidopsis thaliana TaxID=3702 RepID=Q4PSJ0_ARATH|nr:hypothetical protein At4g07868 [Arabidopsis thaliana]
MHPRSVVYLCFYFCLLLIISHTWVGNDSVSNLAFYCYVPIYFMLRLNCRNQIRDLRMMMKIRSGIRRLLIIANLLMYL